MSVSRRAGPGKAARSQTGPRYLRTSIPGSLLPFSLVLGGLVCSKGGINPSGDGAICAPTKTALELSHGETPPSAAAASQWPRR